MIVKGGVALSFLLCLGCGSNQSRPPATPSSSAPKQSATESTLPNSPGQRIALRAPYDHAALQALEELCAAQELPSDLDLSAHSALADFNNIGAKTLGQQTAILARHATQAGLPQCNLLSVWVEQTYAEGLAAICAAPLLGGRLPLKVTDSTVINREAHKVVGKLNRAEPSKQKTILSEALERGGFTEECELSKRL